MTSCHWKIKVYKPMLINNIHVKNVDKLNQLLTWEEPAGNEKEFKIISNNETKVKLKAQ